MKLSGVGERIKEIRGKLDQAEFGAVHGLTRRQISSYERGESPPPIDFLTSLARTNNVNLDWLLTGEGPKEKEVSERLDRPEGMQSLAQKEQAGNFVHIPMVKGEIGAGGAMVADNSIEVCLAFRKDWIRRKGDAKNMSLIRVTGDSMEPTLFTGDIVLVDHNRRHLDPQGGIYAIVLDDAVMVKRLYLDYSSKKLFLVSDNKEKYPPMQVSSDQVIINGKVIWFGRNIDRC